MAPRHCVRLVRPAPAHLNGPCGGRSLIMGRNPRAVPPSGSPSKAHLGVVLCARRRGVLLSGVFGWDGCTSWPAAGPPLRTSISRVFAFSPCKGRGLGGDQTFWRRVAIHHARRRRPVTTSRMSWPPVRAHHVLAPIIVACGGVATLVARGGSARRRCSRRADYGTLPGCGTRRYPATTPATVFPWSHLPTRAEIRNCPCPALPWSELAARWLRAPGETRSIDPHETAAAPNPTHPEFGGPYPRGRPDYYDEQCCARPSSLVGTDRCLPYTGGGHRPTSPSFRHSIAMPLPPPRRTACRPTSCRCAPAAAPCGGSHVVGARGRPSRCAPRWRGSVPGSALCRTHLMAGATSPTARPPCLRLRRARCEKRKCRLQRLPIEATTSAGEVLSYRPAPPGLTPRQCGQCLPARNTLSGTSASGASERRSFVDVRLWGQPSVGFVRNRARPLPPEPERGLGTSRI